MSFAVGIFLLVMVSIPVTMTAVNLLGVYRRAAKVTPDGDSQPLGRISVLIPARDEESSIGQAIESALASGGVELEVIVLDDDSSDHTAWIVKQWLERDSRVRLESAPPLPSGWCGKQHACFVLAGLARHEILVFMDADVRLEPDGLARMAREMDRLETDLLSGVPRQITGTWLEKLLIPLIHTVLLGYLPMPAMRATKLVGFGAGCGQLFMAHRQSYRKMGGHERIRDSMHDGVTLPRAFRRAGFHTDLVDATDLARCRMYRSAAEVWRGLGKNAGEGMAGPKAIVVWTILLGMGHVVAPIAGLALLTGLITGPFDPNWPVALGLTAPWLLRIHQSLHFRQSLLGAAMHPLSVLLLLAIQWQALYRRLAGVQSGWKGRSYPAGAVEG
ncbi:MAG: glycosyltransferase [Phycisphaeraceae bacterium]|nr:glycosyltransferase [Phycisphaeraceae bacterium]